MFGLNKGLYLYHVRLTFKLYERIYFGYRKLISSYTRLNFVTEGYK